MVVAARARSHARLAGPAWDLEVNNGRMGAVTCFQDTDRPWLVTPRALGHH